MMHFSSAAPGRTPRLLALLLPAALALHAQDPALRNPGFEAASKGVPADWTCPSYWSGALKSVSGPASVHGGKLAAELSASNKGGRSWGRIHSAQVPAPVGLTLRFSVHAKGSGSLKLGCIHYQPTNGGTRMDSLWQEQATPLGDGWKQARYDFTPVSNEVEKLALMIEVEGAGAYALLDDAALEIVRQARGELALAPYTALPAGTELVLEGSVTREGRPAAMPVLVIRRADGGAGFLKTNSDAQGRLRLPVRAPAQPALTRLTLVQPELGASATAYVDAVPPELFKRLQSLALAAKPGPMPQHWLFFGDSLTDFSRGYNYVDQLAFWLADREARPPGAAVQPPATQASAAAGRGGLTFRNAGVGGDYITRSLDRLRGKAGTWRLEMYDRVFEPKPSRIFIMLGHNDSKLGSASGFTAPTVKPEDYTAQLTEFIGLVRSNTGAPVTLLTPTSSVYEITKSNADRAVAAGRSASLFGKPEVMAQFAELTREVARGTGSGLVDVLTPTRDHPDKRSLFLAADGVHMTLEGYHVLTLEVLKYLGK